MKATTTLLAVFMVFGLLSFKTSDKAQIQFSTSLEKAKAIAKKENKILFVDNYTTWCGPCKKLDATVFKDEEVAKYFNENFINVKIDVEKGEGPSIKQKYNINSVPTLLFMDHTGKVKHRAVGFQRKGTLLKIAKEVGK